MLNKKYLVKPPTNEVKLLRATVCVVLNLKKKINTGTTRQPPFIPEKFARPKKKARRENPAHS
jgi:hypothetical protein